MKRKHSLWIGTLVTALLGCGDDTTSGGGGSGAGGSAVGGGGQGGTTSGGGGAGGGLAGLTATWHFAEYTAPNPPDVVDYQLVGPNADLEVCLFDESRCATTDADGNAQITGLSPETNIAIVAQKPGFSPLLLQYVVHSTDPMFGSGWQNDDELLGYIGSSGCTVPPAPGKANLWVGIGPGMSVTSSPPMTFVYTAEDGVFDPALTMVPVTTPPLLALAVACDLDPGTFELSIAGGLGNCHMVEGWPPAAGGDLQVLTSAGAITVVNWICE
ncbi:MAG: hypothetical protein U0271_03280 [Polyangiaceae bacterium]